MSEPPNVNVHVTNNGCGSGCGTALGGAIAITVITALVLVGGRYLAGAAALAVMAGSAVLMARARRR